MKTSNQEKRTFDLADLIFTKDNENEGVWVEPELFGVKIGVEFKVIGANCDKLITVIEEFNKKYAEVSAIKDTTERAKALDELYVDTAAKRTIGLRCAPDAEVTIEGNPVEYSDAVVRHIFEKSPVCAQFIVLFSRNTENFTNRKKN